LFADEKKEKEKERKGQKMSKYDNSNQIIRIDGKNCLMEVMSSAFEIGQVQINFATYNQGLEKGSRQTAMISFYIEVAEFLALADDILIGRLSQKAKLAKEKAAASKGYAEAVYRSMGGVSAEKLKASGRAREDGKALSRQMSILGGDKVAFLVIAEQGAGESDAKGLIVPRYGNKPDAKIMVPVTEDAMKQLAAIAKAYIYGFITNQFAIGTVTGKKQPKTDGSRAEIPLPEPPEQYRAG
jgi:hypothetical protein